MSTDLLLVCAGIWKLTTAGDGCKTRPHRPRVADLAFVSSTSPRVPAFTALANGERLIASLLHGALIPLGLNAAQLNLQGTLGIAVQFVQMTPSSSRSSRSPAALGGSE